MQKGYLGNRRFQIHPYESLWEAFSLENIRQLGPAKPGTVRPTSAFALSQQSQADSFFFFFRALHILIPRRLGIPHTQGFPSFNFRGIESLAPNRSFNEDPFKLEQANEWESVRSLPMNHLSN